MDSRSHLALSVLAGLALVPLVETPMGPVWTVAYAAIVGTLVDLDHFVIARLRTGSWHSLRLALTSPRRAVLDQDELFEPGDVGARRRLLSHLLVGGSLVAGLAVPWPSIALVTAVVLALHVLSDVVWDHYGGGPGGSEGPHHGE